MVAMITEDEVRENIARNLQRLLDEKGWSQSDLARAINTSRMNVSQYVRAVRQPSAAKLLMMAEALDVAVEELAKAPKVRAKVPA